MILIYTNASSTGFLFHAEGLSPEQEAAVRAGAEAYNKQEAWTERGCDGSVELHEGADAAVRAHNEAYEGDDEEQVDGLAGLQAWYNEAEDGHAETVSAKELVDLAGGGAGPWRRLGYEA